MGYIRRHLRKFSKSEQIERGKYIYFIALTVVVVESVLDYFFFFDDFLEILGMNAYIFIYVLVALLILLPYLLMYLGKLWAKRLIGILFLLGFIYYTGVLILEIVEGEYTTVAITHSAYLVGSRAFFLNEFLFQDRLTAFVKHRKEQLH